MFNKFFKKEKKPKLTEEEIETLAKGFADQIIASFDPAQSFSASTKPYVYKSHKDMIEKEKKQIIEEHLQNQKKHAKEKQWGLFRNDCYTLGDFYKKEKQYELALKYFLQVCYLDLSGPNNVGIYHDGHKTSFEGEEWMPERWGEVSPIMNIVGIEMRKRGVTIEKIHNVFLEEANILYQDYNPPISPATAWITLEPEFKKELDSKKLNTPSHTE